MDSKLHRIFNTLLGISFIEGLFFFFQSLIIPGDPKNAFLLGLSKSRLLLLAAFLFLLLCLLLLFVFSKRIQNGLSKFVHSVVMRRLITGVGIFSIILFWVTLKISPEHFLDFKGAFIRIRPLLLWLEIMGIQSYLCGKIFSKPTLSWHQLRHVQKRTFLGFFIGLLGIWVFITTTKNGLVLNTAYWNVAGIPLSGVQLFGIILLIFSAWLLIPVTAGNNLQKHNKFLAVMIPVVIYLAAVILWGSTPMLKHFFSLEPTSPNYQPYPYSDARVHDLGALSIVKGEGIYFHGYTDKPMYMLFLAFLHLFAKNNYDTMAWLQICVLALIPVLLYFLGKRIRNPLFGIALSLAVMFQQANAIRLSYIIASVNPKLLVSEELMLLGIILATFLLFLWIKTREKIYALLLGGVIGTLSLVRMNPVFLIPLVVIVGFFLLKKNRKNLLHQLLLFSLGFLIVFAPWLATGVDSQGHSWFILKIQDVFNVRYIQNSSTENNSGIPAATTSSLPDSAQKSLNPLSASTATAQVGISTNDTAEDDSESGIGHSLFLIENHFLHNFSTSLLALPDSLSIDKLEVLSQREYWQDENQWTGNFPLEQYVLILVNLALISLGLAESWKKHRWAGLSPLFVFLAYDVSLSFAMNSGSRYIVPINWVIFFYYFLGLMVVLRKIFNFVSMDAMIQKDELMDQAHIEPGKRSRSLIPAFIGLIIIGSLIPITNIVIPSLAKSSQKEDISAQMNIPGIFGEKIESGEILYPYYDQETGKYITFDFLAENKTTTYRIEKKNLVDDQLVLESELPAFISFSTSYLGKQSPAAIYIIKDNQLYLIWLRYDLEKITQ